MARGWSEVKVRAHPIKIQPFYADATSSHMRTRGGGFVDAHIVYN